MLNERAAAAREMGASRRLLAAVFAASLVVAWVPRVEAASGGPDGFGYTWRDGNEPGVTFAWEDISATGLDWPTQFGDDINLGARTLSFPFPYYGSPYTTVAACTNGWISPVDFTSATWTNGPLPAVGAPMGLIAAFWDDLYTTSGISRILFQDFGDHAVITWERVHDLGDANAVNSFQAILFSDGRIRVQYLDMRGDRTSCSVGIESPNEQYGLTVLRDGNPGVPPNGNYVVEFLPPVPVPTNLDCTRAVPVACGDRITANTLTGVADQDGYLCSRNDYSGRELIYRLDLATPTTVRMLLDATSGNPDLIVVSACDPNICLGPPADRADLTNATGTYYLVVDSALGQEGAFTLRVECNPMAADLDCANAVPITCGARVAGDTRNGQARQDAYWCTEADYAGRENVYVLDLPTPTTLRMFLDVQAGNPDLIVLPGCDPNTCLDTPGDTAQLTNYQGSVFIIVDSAPGEEGPYELRIDCYPVLANVDCANASPLACGSSVDGDLSLGQARQDIYWCNASDFSGREQVYILDLAAAAQVSFELDELSGDPDLLVIGPCDPNNCAYLDKGRTILAMPAGTAFLVVDCAPGEEGRYHLHVDCLIQDLPFCGTGLVETDGYGDQSGAWNVNGWYFPTDTSELTVRVDGGPRAYGHNPFSGCTEFPQKGWGTVPPSGPALAAWSAPEVSLLADLREVTSGGCCGLLVTMSVTNNDVVPHYFEYRVAHDLTFGIGDGGACGVGGNIDGGPIEVNGTRYMTEQDLLPLGGTTCDGQIQCFSADHPTELRASYQMLAPNLPQVMEWDYWPDTTSPCPNWRGILNGDSLGNCGNDSALTMIWRFPQGAGTLAPGATDTARYRIGWKCAWPCNVACEDPTLSSGSAVDGGPCNDGIRLAWLDAMFPGAGNGTYHVYRSTVSWADALLQPRLTPPAGISTPSFVDATTTANQTYFYVVQAESLDFPGCGSGPVVSGSTAELDLPPVTDNSDTVGPATVVGAALRAVGKTLVTVDFDWRLAPPPAPQEHYVVHRADNVPQGPFLIVGQPAVRSWTDPDAPNAGDHHCFFYQVKIADECGNESAE
jgi:hypothetical protein